MTNAYDTKIRALAVLFSFLPTLLPGQLQAASEQEDLANARWFQVEVIVFQHLNRNFAKHEDWPEIVGVDLPDNALPLNPPPPPAAAPPDIITTEPVVNIRPLDPQQLPLNGSGEDPASVDPELLVAAPEIPTPYEILDEEELQLGKLFTSLRRSQGFRPLMHLAWRQPTYERDQATPVLIYDGIEEAAPLPPELPVVLPETVAENVAGLTPGEVPLEAEPLSILPPQRLYPTEDDLKIGPRNPLIVGSLKLSVSRYLHIDADLLFRQMTPQLEPVPVPNYVLWTDRPYPTLRQLQGPAYEAYTWEAIRAFRLKESRRMRSTEIHHLDHPYFGLIVMVTPYEIPVPEPMAPIPAPRKVLD